ncbi:MAG TPA: 3-oxoacyl-ACP reductase family protein [Solirubrobacteraceae bacterium]|jgi:2-hydroxycyclohexanecarboxyl-CoA dehydrogenase|nr:3-oxoacyl-ACP reductase family protein [Solirubrobacteraceae bacterium]
MGIALVTGAARGIGRAIAEQLAADGHQVVVADILEQAAAETAAAIGGLAVQLDVTDAASVDRATTKAERELGPINILVNNAGWDEFKPFLETDEPLWDRIIEINFKGCLRCCRRVVPGMVEREHGRVVNIGSDAARVGSSLEAVYSGAKAGVVAFSKTLAREVAKHGVTVNVVCPGPTDTALLATMGERTRDALARAVPLRRIGTPQDIAPAVAFLASDGAAFITGQTLSVSGGLTMA